MKLAYSPFVIGAGPVAVQVWENSWAVQHKPGMVLVRLRQGGFTPRDLAVLERLAGHRFLSGLQLYRMVFSAASRRVAKDRLGVLQDKGLVDCFRWQVNGGKLSSVKVYTLSHLGEKFLDLYHGSNLGTRLRDNVRSMAYVFKILVANELYLNLSPRSGERPGLTEFRLMPEGMAGVTALFRFNNQRSKAFLVEVVRRDGLDWRRRGEFLKDYYRRFGTGEEVPVLLLVAEDDHHARDVYEALGDEEIPCRYTTDGRFFGRPLYEKGALFKFGARGELVEVEAEFFKVDDHC